MEQVNGNFHKDQQMNPEHISYNSMENRNEVVGNLNQRFSQDPSNYMNMNMRPADLNIAAGPRPVHYSIQTGEEFALEFMWERSNPRQHYILNPSVEANNESRPVDLQGMLGVSRIATAQRAPDASLFPSMQMREVQDPTSNPPIREEKPIGQLPQSASRTSLKNSRAQSFRSNSSLGSSSGSSRRMKLLCSFGGTIMPRPRDRKLRYVGGETRILRISKDISWEELKQKAATIYNEPHSIKYQLPGEDLDALVSVSSDEDLQNMMEECKAFDDGGSQKLRIFLISNNDMEDPQLDLDSTEGDSEIQYVVAVNCMDFGSRRNSIGVDLGNNLDELMNSHDVRETGQTAVSLPAGSHVHPGLLSSMPNQSSQVELPSSSYAFEANSVGYHVQTIKPEQPEWNMSRGFHQMNILPTPDERTRVPSSATNKYDYGYSASNHAPVAENTVQNPTIGHMGPQNALNMGEIYGSFDAKVPGVPGPEKNIDYKTVALKKTESQKEHSSEADKQMRESSISRSSDFTKVQSLHDAVSAPSAATDKGVLMMQAKGNEESLDQAKNYMPSITVPNSKMNRLDSEDNAYTSTAAFMPVRGEHEANTMNTSHEPDVLPQRIFHSERIHRELAGPNRIFKSDESSAPQLLMARSDVSQQITESVDKLTDRNATGISEAVGAFAKSTFVNSLAVEEKLNGSPSLADNGTASSVHDKNEENKAEQSTAVCPIAVNSTPSSITNQGTSEYPHGESAQASMEIHQNRMDKNANDGKFHDIGRGDAPLAETSQSNPRRGSGTSVHESILIDINDRFPHDFLSDVFSQAKIAENSSGVTALHDYAAGLSVNMTNHEPQHWSFFQNLARDNSRKDASLMDQDHPNFSSSQANTGEEPSGNYGYPHLDAVQVKAESVDSSRNLGADNQRQSSGPVKPDAVDLPLPSDYDISQATGIQTNHPMNSRIAESNHEV